MGLERIEKTMESIDRTLQFIDDTSVFYYEQFELFFESQNFGDGFYYLPSLEYFVKYQNGVYRRVEKDEDDVDKIIQDWLDLNRIKDCAQKMNLMRRRLSVIYQKRLVDFDTEAHIYNVKNGLLDLTTKTLLPHTKEYLSLHQAKVEFHITDQIKPTPCWDSLKTLYGKTIDYIEWFVRCIIFGVMSDEKSLHLVGPPRHGKGSVLNMIELMFSPDMIGHLSMEELGDEFKLDALVRKRVNIDKEGIISRWNAKVVKNYKTITGRDGAITVNPKHAKPYDYVFIPFFFITASNQLYTLPPTDVAAFFSRPVIVEMMGTIEKEDPTFKDRLLEEGSDIFSRLVYEGYEPFSVFYERIEKKPYNPKAFTEEMRQKWEDWSNPVTMMCNELFIRSEGMDELDVDEVLQAVSVALSENGYLLASEGVLKPQITTALKRMNIIRKHTGSRNYYTPILLRDEDRPEKEASDTLDSILAQSAHSLLPKLLGFVKDAEWPNFQIEDVMVGLKLNKDEAEQLVKEGLERNQLIFRNDVYEVKNE